MPLVGGAGGFGMAASIVAACDGPVSRRGVPERVALRRRLHLLSDRRQLRPRPWADVERPRAGAVLYAPAVALLVYGRLQHDARAVFHGYLPFNDRFGGGGCRVCVEGRSIGRGGGNGRSHSRRVGRIRRLFDFRPGEPAHASAAGDFLVDLFARRVLPPQGKRGRHSCFRSWPRWQRSIGWTRSCCLRR